MTSTLSRSLLLPVSLCLLLLAGCATDRSRSVMQRLAQYEANALLRQGEEALASSDYQGAVYIYEVLAARYPFSPEADQARLNKIYAYYRLGEAESAKDAADTFIRENPAHPRIDYAWYLQGLIDFERMPIAIERWLRVDLAARPPQTAHDSFEALRTVVTRYPQSPYAADARQRMVYLRNRLADYELSVASHYMERGAWVAAGQRARQAIEEYDGAPAMKDALRILIHCYRKLDYADLAENAERVFLENFPGESPRYDEKQTSWWRVWS